MIKIIIENRECLFDDLDWEKIRYLGTLYIDTKPNERFILRFGSGTYKFKVVSRIIMNVIDSSLEVDHKDGNTLNNTRNNLRIVTSQQNKFNTTVAENKKSKLPKGVSRNRDSFRAMITINYTQYNLGTYQTIYEAETAYKEAANKYQGEFACHNSRS